MSVPDIVNYFFCASQALIQPILLYKTISRKPIISFFALFSALNFAAYVLPLPLPFGICLSLSSMVLYCRFALSESRCCSAFYGLLSSEIIWLCSGLSNSVISLINGSIGGFPLQSDGVFYMIFGGIIALALYWLIGRATFQIIRTKLIEPQSFLIVLLPLLMLFIVEIYIVKSLYSAVNTDFELRRDVEILIVQAVGAASVFSILFAYKKCAEAFEEHEKIRVYENECHYRRQYAMEIKQYYDSAKALRHDFKNHILIVGELLRKNRFDQAANYISELDVSANGGDLLFHTDCIILDIILAAKLSDISEFVKVEIGAVPEIDETDICTIFANALDNAVCAISNLSDNNKFISVITKKRGDMLFIEIKNSFDGKTFRPGIGIENIIRTAEKYGGTARVTSEGNLFSLKIILCNSHQ